MSVRSAPRAAISRATSKSPSWIRIVAGTLMSSAGHRREEGDLAGAGDRGIGLHMGMVDRGADHLRLLEGVGISLVARRKPGHEIADRVHARRRLDRLFRL